MTSQPSTPSSSEEKIINMDRVKLTGFILSEIDHYLKHLSKALEGFNYPPEIQIKVHKAYADYIFELKKRNEDSL